MNKRHMCLLLFLFLATFILFGCTASETSGEAIRGPGGYWEEGGEDADPFWEEDTEDFNGYPEELNEKPEYRISLLGKSK